MSPHWSTQQIHYGIVLRDHGPQWISGLGPFLQTLQVDVLAEIFFWSLPEDVEQEQKPTLRTAPFNLASVCRRWREVALSNPALWARFGIVYESNRIGDEMFYSIPLKWFLKRSRSSPLTFNIRTNRLDVFVSDLQNIYPYEETFIPPFRGLCGNVVAHQERWKKARMEYYISSHISDVKMELVDMPLLEELHIHFPVQGPRMIVDLARSPLVCKLSLVGCFQLRFGGEALQSLTSVYLAFNHPSKAFPSMNDVASVLQSAPQLEEIFADVISNHVSGPMPKLVMQKLRKAHFIFKLSGGAIIQSFFNSITLPALKDFLIVLGIATALSNQLDYFGMPALLERSQTSLESLHVQGMPVSQNEILECLRASPQLKTLAVSGPHLNGTFIENLVLRPTEGEWGQLCPAMEKLYIAHCFLADAREHIANMISSRWKLNSEEPHYLKQIGFHQTGLGMGGGLIRLLSIKDRMEDGLKLTITEEDGF